VGRFPKIYSATLRAGERSGYLDKVLAQYLSYQRTTRTFRKKFLSALIYPTFLMVFLFVGLAQAHSISPQIGYGIAIPLAVVAIILAAIRFKQRKDKGE